MLELLFEKIIYVIFLCLAIYCVGGIKFEKFMNVAQPNKVRVLAILLQLSLAYMAGSFVISVFRMVAFY